MVVSSRSKSVSGPWEHSPYNPIIHTYSDSETWWSTGHGTLVSTPDDHWWIMYHGYEKGFHTLGRQTLMEPLEWTDDGWFRKKKGSINNQPLPYSSSPAKETSPGMPLSDDFTGGKLGLQWSFFKEFDPSRFAFNENGLVMKARGSSPADSSPLLVIPTNHSYEISLELEVRGQAEGGLLLYYDNSVFVGIGCSAGLLTKYERGLLHSQQETNLSGIFFLKIINQRHQVSFFYSQDGVEWARYPSGAEVSGYHHNTFGHFLSLRAGLCASGEGEVVFRNFSYQGMDH